MGKEFDIYRWILSAAFVLAFGGMLISLAVIVIELQPSLSATLLQKRQAGTGGQLSGDALPSRFFSTATLTPFQPGAPWTATPSLSPSPTPTASPTVTQTLPPPTPTETPLPTTTPEPPQPTLEESVFPPQEANLTGITGYAQLYTLDCEARSAVDMAAFLGVSIDEHDFLNRLPRSDNPDEGFVGEYWDARGQIPPASYGVYAAPVAALLREYGLNAVDGRGISWDTIRSEVASGRPVMVWVVGNTLAGGKPIEYTASNGRTTAVVHYQHTVLVIGYNTDYVTILDGNMVYYRTIDQFFDSWSVLGYMAVWIQ